MDPFTLAIGYVLIGAGVGIAVVLIGHSLKRH